MKNMKVSLKLIVSFLVVVALAIAVGAFGIIGMSRINAADVSMYNNNYLPTVLAGNMSQKIVEQRVQMRNLVIYDVNLDSDIFKSAEDSLETSRKDMETLISDYEKTIAHADDAAAFQEFKNLYNGEWKTMVDSIHTFGVNNKTQEAKTALTNATVIAGELDTLSDNLQQVNLDEGKAAVDSNSTLFITMTIVECVILVVAVTVAMLLAFYISGLISKPLVAMSAFLNKASESGEIVLSQEEVEQIGKFGESKDETGQCVKSLSNFIARVTEVSKALEMVADGDLTTEIKLLSQKDTMGLSLEKMVSNLNSMFSEIHTSTTQVSTGAKQIADGSQALAQGSTQQAAAVEQLSSSISEIAGKTKENAKMADRASTLAGTIKQNAEKGSHQMDQMMEAVKEINQASQSINKVISVIDNIAFQTNILALNAAVEAARAGQHGKGFAVVAEEVRNLASKSAEAAKETGTLIANSIEKAELGARIADETAASLVDIVSGINESTQLVSEIARSSDEQSEGISQINRGIDQVAQVVQQNSATAEQSAAASEQMSSQSSMLEELISQFKLKQGGSARVSLPAAGKKAKQLVMPEKTAYAPVDNGDFGKY